MNGGDLHYHLSQHGVFSESEVGGGKGEGGVVDGWVGGWMDG